MLENELVWSPAGTRVVFRSLQDYNDELMLRIFPVETLHCNVFYPYLSRKDVALQRLYQTAACVT